MDDRSADDLAGDERTRVEQAATAELERLLLDRGALTVEDLSTTFEGAAPELAADLVATGRGTLLERVGTLVRHGERFWQLGDGRAAAVLHHLRRATFTHRLTERELTKGAVDLSPDLVALALPRTFRLAAPAGAGEDGPEITVAGPDADARAAENGSLLGPDGWLAAFAPGDLVAWRYDGEVAHLDPVAYDALDAEAGRSVGTALAAAYATLRSDRAPEVHRVIVDAMGTDPVCFSVAVAPVTQLLAATGLRVRDAWVGAADRLWATPIEQARRRRAEELLGDSDQCCHQAAGRALDAWQAWLSVEVEGGPPRTAAVPTARLAEDIAHGPVAGLLAELAAVGRPVATVARLGRWATAVAEAGTGPTSARVEYLRALGADAAGDAPAAEARLLAALAVEPDDTACLGFLAELRADRGDAEAVLALHRRAGRAPGPETLAELEPFVTARSVGRNEPCPCGSGRKYKACCTGRTLRRPMEDRGRWLLRRAGRHAVRRNPFAVRTLRSLFDATNGFGVPGGNPADPNADASAGLVTDLVLFAEGGLRGYLDVRGPLLPEDEFQCAQGWVDAPMRLLEVVSVGADGDGLVDTTDAAHGESRLLVLPAGAIPSELSPGQLVLARPLPVGERWILGTALVPVPEEGRDRAVALAQQDIGAVQLLQFLVELQLDALKGLPARLA